MNAKPAQQATTLLDLVASSVTRTALLALLAAMINAHLVNWAFSLTVLNALLAQLIVKFAVPRLLIPLTQYVFIALLASTFQAQLATNAKASAPSALASITAKLVNLVILLMALSA
jgi:hypothetical protein